MSISIILLDATDSETTHGTSESMYSDFILLPVRRAQVFHVLEHAWTRQHGSTPQRPQVPQSSVHSHALTNIFCSYVRSRNPKPHLQLNMHPCRYQCFTVNQGLSSLVFQSVLISLSTVLYIPSLNPAFLSQRVSADQVRETTRQKVTPLLPRSLLITLALSLFLFHSPEAIGLKVMIPFSWRKRKHPSHQVPALTILQTFL